MCADTPDGGTATAAPGPAGSSQSPDTVGLPRRRRPVIVDRLLLAAIGAAVGLLVHGYVVESSVVLENSMAPTLTVGDRLLLSKLGPRLGRLRRGDVVVFPAPQGGGLLVKRIVGLGGDVVEARGGILMVNRRAVDEPYAVMSPGYRAGPFEVPEGDAYVLGDNRDWSEDSSVWRAGIPTATILGRAVWLYWPYGRPIPE